MIRLKSTRANTEGGLKRVLEKLLNPTPALEEIGQMLVDRTKRRISTTKARPTGQKWSKWAPSTKKAREADGTASRGLLNHTGTLLNAIQYEVKNKSAVVGVDGSAPYAGFLQFGTAKMPARPFIGLIKIDQNRISLILHRHLTRR